MTFYYINMSYNYIIQVQPPKMIAVTRLLGMIVVKADVTGLFAEHNYQYRTCKGFADTSCVSLTLNVTRLLFFTFYLITFLL